MTRAEIHSLFVSKFHRGDPPAPVSMAEIGRGERELGTVFPQSYITFMQTHGSVRTPSILSLIVAGMHEMCDVMVFSEISDVIEGTRSYWSAGMSEQMVGFASDSMGNLFCFRRVDPDTVRADDAEIWFFDHDFCSDSKIADGFDEWLLSYITLSTEDESRRA